jgi:hypothetical protein
MVKKNNIVVGLIFVLLGVLFLLKNVNIINFNIFDLASLIANFWPALFLILPSVLMHSVFFTGKNRDAGILVPAGILLVVGLTCQLSMLFGIWGISWPGYLLAVAVGLFELYLFGNRDKGLLIPIIILGGLSVVFFNWFSFKWLFGVQYSRFIIPVLLVVFGLLIIFKNSNRNNEFK